MSRFTPHLLLLFVGGLASSLGMAHWARSDRGRRFLGKLRWPGITTVSVLSLAAMALAVWWAFRRFLGASGGEALFGSAWPLLLFGIGVGLPMGLPQLIAVWNEVRPAKRAERERRATEATREDREAFARELLEEVHRVSPAPRKLEAFLRGDEGRVLWFEGELAQDEGERLVEALRRDLKETGFRRVEVRGGAGNWWTKV